MSYTVTMPLDDFERLQRQAEAGWIDNRITELTKEGNDWQRRCREATSQTEGLYKRIKELEAENAAILAGNADMQEQAQRLEADAALGRLVRAMDYSSVCLLEKTHDGWNAISRSKTLGFDKYHDKTPGKVLIAAGVGKVAEPATEGQGAANADVLAYADRINREHAPLWEALAKSERQETPTNSIHTPLGYCPVTTDHCCPKKDNCSGEPCVMNTAVMS